MQFIKVPDTYLLFLFWPKVKSKAYYYTKLLCEKISTRKLQFFINKWLRKILKNNKKYSLRKFIKSRMRICGIEHIKKNINHNKEGNVEVD